MEADGDFDGALVPVDDDDWDKEGSALSLGVKNMLRETDLDAVSIVDVDADSVRERERDGDADGEDERSKHDTRVTFPFLPTVREAPPPLKAELV